MISNVYLNKKVNVQQKKERKETEKLKERKREFYLDKLGSRRVVCSGTAKVAHSQALDKLHICPLFMMLEFSLKRSVSTKKNKKKEILVTLRKDKIRNGGNCNMGNKTRNSVFGNFRNEAMPIVWKCQWFSKFVCNGCDCN